MTPPISFVHRSIQWSHTRHKEKTLKSYKNIHLFSWYTLIIIINNMQMVHIYIVSKYWVNTFKIERKGEKKVGKNKKNTYLPFIIRFSLLEKYYILTCVSCTCVSMYLLNTVDSTIIIWYFAYVRIHIFHRCVHICIVRFIV